MPRCLCHCILEKRCTVSVCLTRQSVLEAGRTKQVHNSRADAAEPLITQQRHYKHESRLLFAMLELLVLMSRASSITRLG
eukprot:4014169-Amphidinium_carterae.1